MTDRRRLPTNSRFRTSNVTSPRAAADVLEVLTEVEEKSRRSPEIIQYFTVSPTPEQKAKPGGVRRVNACATVCRTTCRDSWLPPRSCVGTWPSAWRCAASRTTPGNASHPGSGPASACLG